MTHLMRTGRATDPGPWIERSLILLCSRLGTLMKNVRGVLPLRPVPMNRYAHNFFLLLLGCVYGLAAMESAGADSCPEFTAHQVEKLSGVPEEIKFLLGTELPGVAGMAERGAKFNATDVILEPFPMRRFQGAVLSEACAVVTVERGGIAHYFEDAYFEFQEGHWRLIKLAKTR